ncbi:double-strand break repair helicase AddA [Altererythrobacter luteolus]|uniref:DNA 3'-5' helicase n=1 Tax=Pontixanthobacter luteolus TaxID=295089 RepID=A0A6I4UZ94_9SPHN|nr:double-strand break repair helicase AddA [Pontixanthobacter luteolus]MXP46815.1 double-strand break repair helicase AddA [Pontixanthobacter luteolus]
MSSAPKTGRVFPLQENQALAVDPQESVWLSASAGTGKTQVLSARVLRLLLRQSVDPSQILCLTFTKAGAAEMATRVNEVLANWVRMKPEVLAKDLRAIGAPIDEATQSRARSLFASVLDCPGGGLRIDTIHAFAQWLLAAFPEEAGLAPGTRAMEDRDRELLAHDVLADMLVEWESAGETDLLDSLAMLSIQMAADKTQAWLMRCANARELWFGPDAWPDDLMPRVKSLLGLGVDAKPEDLAELCMDENFDVDALKQCAAAAVSWGRPTGLKIADAIADWLAASPKVRLEKIDELNDGIFTKSKAPRWLASIVKHEPDYQAVTDRALDSISKITEMRMRFEFADRLAPALRVGRRFALRWEEAKSREGFIDFDDQIRRAAMLLSRSDMADWIRYKLDRRFDHLLIDEAQDTNEAQWSIIRALTGDFFAGEGQHDDKLRTIFVVGDYKQAIFGFQGTSPENFEIAREHFDKEMSAAADNAAQIRGGNDVRELLKLGLGRSYRTAQPVLDFVDAVIEKIGIKAFGLTRDPGKHKGDERPGEVVLWKPISAAPADDDAATSNDNDGTELRVTGSERRMADAIANQVRDWLDHGYPLVKGGTPRNAGPGDIMVLVRKRKELAGLIVARLYARGIPVAGVDRLRLGEPLAVKDLMAALRFAAQPLDDLELANLLVSPLIGWSQEDLLQHAWRDQNVRLWDHIRKSDAPLAVETADRLRDLLRLADFEPPQALLHWMLLGPWQGRKKLIARLGKEANDPIDELLNAALGYSSVHTASLQGFIQWFDASESDLKREAGASEGLVRVMTVHGSKGLQAPIVILADATGNPDNSDVGGVTLTEKRAGGGEIEVPVLSLRTDEMIDPVREAKEASMAIGREEHWRLLYVAMTRAEEALFVGGALGKTEKIPAPDSWYARLESLMPEESEEGTAFGSYRVWGRRPEPVSGGQTPDAHSARSVSLPDWVTTPIGPEPRPPRPLAPSAVGEEQAADPPLPPDAVREAARRGVLIHKLLERLPDVAVEERNDRAEKWLAVHAADLSGPARDEIALAAIRVIGDASFAALFSDQALAEVPLAATVDGQVVAGIADRLLVTASEVTVVDFKTARRPPETLSQVPEATIRQMSAYGAALQAIYPDKAVRAALLYTQTPKLIEIPAEMMAAGKSRLSTRQESFPPMDVE